MPESTEPGYAAMKKIALTFLLMAALIIFPGAVRAEDVDLGGGSVFMLGLSFPNFGDLNESLAAQGYPQLSGPLGLCGGGGYGFVGRVMLGGEVFGGVQAGGNGNGLTSYTVGGGMFETGYAVVAQNNMAVFPYLGIGGAAIQLAAENHLDKTRFEDHAGGVLLRLGVGGHYRLRFANDHAESGFENLIFSVRLGYNLPVGSSWNLQGFPGSPWAGMSGPFIALTIGGSGFPMPAWKGWGHHGHGHGDTIIIFGD